MKICETFSGNSLKEDLSIDTTFDPCYFLWDSPFNAVLVNYIFYFQEMGLFKGFILKKHSTESHQW